jgi:mono/diheme cytochrome c family protein
MKSACIALAIALFALSAEFARAGEGENALAEKGEKLYRAYCFACHGADASHPVAGAKNLHEFTGDQATFASIVKNGRKAMPAHSYLSADDFAALYAYVKSK